MSRSSLRSSHALRATGSGSGDMNANPSADSLRLLAATLELDGGDWDGQALTKALRVELPGHPLLADDELKSSVYRRQEAVVELIRLALSGLPDEPDAALRESVAKELASALVAEGGLLPSVVRAGLTVEVISQLASKRKRAPTKRSRPLGLRRRPPPDAERVRKAKHRVEGFLARLPKAKDLSKRHRDHIREGSREPLFGDVQYLGRRDVIGPDVITAWVATLASRGRHYQAEHNDYRCLRDAYGSLKELGRAGAFVPALGLEQAPRRKETWVGEAQVWEGELRALVDQLDPDRFVRVEQVEDATPLTRKLDGLESLRSGLPAKTEASSGGGQDEGPEAAHASTEVKIEARGVATGADVPAGGRSLAAPAESAEPDSGLRKLTPGQLAEPEGAGAGTAAAGAEARSTEALDSGDVASKSLSTFLDSLYQAHVLAASLQDARLAAAEALEHGLNLCEKVRARAVSEQSLSSTSRGMQAVSQKLEALSEALVAARGRLRTEDERAALALRLQRYLPDTDWSEIEADDASYAGLEQAAAVWEGVRSLPEWVVEDLMDLESPAARLLALAGDADLRNAAEALSTWAAGLDDEHSDALATMDPVEGPLGVEALETACRAWLDGRNAAGALDDRIAEAIDPGVWKLSVEGMGERRAQQAYAALFERFDRMKPRLDEAAPGLCVPLERALREKGLACRETLSMAESALTLAETDAMLALLLEKARDLDLMERAVRTTRKRSPQAGLPSRTPQVSLNHAVSHGHSPVRARLTLVPVRPPTGAVHFRVKVPLHLRVEDPPPGPMTFRLHSPQLQGRLPGRLLAEALTLEVAEQEGRVWDAHLAVEVPLHRDFDPKLRPHEDELEIHADLLDASGMVLASSQKRRFTDLEPLGDADQRFQNPLAQKRIEPPEVWSRRIGAQRRLDEVFTHMLAHHGSFYVAAPRRFGKSHMILALAFQVQQHEDTSVAVVAVDGDRNRVGFWNELCNRLGERFGPSDTVSTGPRGEPLPGARHQQQTFQNIRQAAAGQGVRTIWVLVDEAQRLFSGADHLAFGDALKDCLWHDLDKRSDEAAALHFGFFGQAHLPQRIGPNFRGELNDYSVDAIEPDDLEALLRADRGGLQTSREARQRLAQQAENFWILRELLTEAQEYLRKEGRSWIIGTDVQLLVDNLFDAWERRKLLDYVQDPLNDSDDANIWKPAPTYPVALALARANGKGFFGAKAEREVHRTLEVWSQRTVLKQEVARLLDELKERRLILGNELRFRTELTRRILADSVRFSTAQDIPEDVDTLLRRLSVGTVSVPSEEELEPLGEGGQATLFRHGPNVYRIEELADEGARRRFLKTCEVYQRLKDSLQAADDVSQSFPSLVEWGFVDRTQDRRGVLVYRYVPGESLAPSAHTVKAVAWTGYCIARALLHLSNLKIFHRDVKPNNIIFRRDGRQGGGHPVLIDFGLSRAQDMGHSVTTGVQGSTGYIPPEVLQDGPRAWTDKGDLYALGKTMRNALAPSAQVPTSLDRVLTDLTQNASAARPTPDGAVSLLRNVCEELKVMGDREAARELYEEMVRPLKPRFRAVAMKFVDSAVAVELDIWPELKPRVIEAAQLLNDLFEARVVSTHGGQGNGLSAAFRLVELDPDFQHFKCREGTIVGKLRNASAHHSWEQNWQEALRLASGDEQRLVDALRHIAGLLDQRLVERELTAAGAAPVSDVVELFVR